MPTKKKKVVEKQIKNQPAQDSALLDLGVKFFLTVLAMSLVFYFVKTRNASFDKVQDTTYPYLTGVPSTTPVPTLIPNKFAWKTYDSKEFGYSIQYPASLAINDLGSNGGYVDFVRFEEAPELGLEDKGIAVGVSPLTVEKETANVKNQIDKDGGAILVSETKIEFKGFPAVRLYYKPEDKSIEEERIIMIVKGGGRYTYSISTVPGQIEKVIEGFNFVEN